MKRVLAVLLTLAIILGTIPAFAADPNTAAGTGDGQQAVTNNDETDPDPDPSPSADPDIQTGWRNVDNTWYYYREDGTPATGWTEVDGAFYYMDETGAMKTGWQSIADLWYYLDPVTGARKTGWLTWNSSWYYLDPDQNGAMQTGWLKWSGHWYYLDPDQSGAMKTGWLKSDGSWYYLDPDQSGAMKTGWLEDDSAWYYLNSDGKMATGWISWSGGWYYLNASGKMATGWLKWSGHWYYLNANGKMLTGWQKVGSSWYYMNTSGAMQTGWLQLGSAWYYLNSSGVMVTGWQKISGTSYYFDTSTGKLTTKTSSTIDPSKPMVALTYDDGPYTPVTSRILDALEKVGGRCTFFNVGNRVSTYSAVVKRAVSMGCLVENHTWDHTDLTTLSTSGISTEISKCNSAIYSATGVTPKLVRPVGGSFNSTVRSTVNAPLILWSIDTEDWKYRNATTVYNNVIGHVKDGDIILMHDLYTSTAAASEKIIPELVREGYQLVTVEELAYYKGYTLTNGKAYYSFR